MTKTKKGVTAANISHPNSRKAAQLVKQIHRGSARKKSKMVHMIKQNALGEKIIWFRDHLEPNAASCTHEMLADLIEKYLARFDEELEQIKLKHSIGKRKNNRQHASREDIIKLTQLQEREWYSTCGIELPDLFNPVQLSLVQKWQGELRFLQNFKLRRFTRSFLRATNSVQSSRPVSPENSTLMTDAAEEDKVENKNEAYQKITVEDDDISDNVMNEDNISKSDGNRNEDVKDMTDFKNVSDAKPDDTESMNTEV